MSKYVVFIKGKKNAEDNLTVKFDNARDAMGCKRTAEQQGFTVEVRKSEEEEKIHDH